MWMDARCSSIIRSRYPARERGESSAINRSTDAIARSLPCCHLGHLLPTTTTMEWRPESAKERREGVFFQVFGLYLDRRRLLDSCQIVGARACGVTYLELYGVKLWAGLRFARGFRRRPAGFKHSNLPLTPKQRLCFRTWAS